MLSTEQHIKTLELLKQVWALLLLICIVHPCISCMIVHDNTCPGTGNTEIYVYKCNICEVVLIKMGNNYATIKGK